MGWEISFFFIFFYENNHGEILYLCLVIVSTNVAAIYPQNKFYIL